MPYRRDFEIFGGSSANFRGGEVNTYSPSFQSVLGQDPLTVDLFFPFPTSPFADFEMSISIPQFRFEPFKGSGGGGPLEVGGVLPVVVDDSDGLLLGGCAALLDGGGVVA